MKCKYPTNQASPAGTSPGGCKWLIGVCSWLSFYIFTHSYSDVFINIIIAKLTDALQIIREKVVILFTFYRLESIMTCGFCSSSLNFDKCTKNRSQVKRSLSRHVTDSRRCDASMINFQISSKNLLKFHRSKLGSDTRKIRSPCVPSSKRWIKL